MRHLARVVEHITGEQGLLPAGAKLDADVTGAVAGRRDQVHLRADAMISFNEIDHSGVDHGTDRILEYGDLRLAATPIAPVLVLGAIHQVARIAERRDPTSVDEPRIPADVIDMQNLGVSVPAPFLSVVFR
jgi:hypothetical protein